MRKEFKKIISTVCAVTLVVGSLTFTNKQNVEAVGKTTAATSNKSLNQGISLLADDTENGTYTEKVTSTLNGVESEGSVSDAVEVVSVLTTDNSAVEGFQIKTNGADSNIAFRTVCKGINVGSTITASDGNKYTVKQFGIIYALDPNQSGYRKKDALNTAYTILNPDVVTGQQYSYEGKIQYAGSNVTYGFLASDGAVINNWDTTDTENTYYVVTMNGINPQITNSIFVRSFIIATDTAGNDTIIYGKKTAVMSVAEVADYLYRNSKAQNYSGHKYLFENILSTQHFRMAGTITCLHHQAQHILLQTERWKIRTGG